MAVRQESRKELARALQERYWRSDKAGRGRILDAFCEATGTTGSTRLSY
jgi:hypothetical protein